MTTPRPTLQSGIHRATFTSTGFPHRDCSVLRPSVVLVDAGHRLVALAG
ncbi:MAG: hypothetical protein ABJC19_00295 [Gemmatimonadota bacterium]